MAPEYDYLLGVAALDSGRNDEAIIAFERVLALIPNHAGAQMDIARAYYATGSFDLAEAAFLKLRAANPPAAAQQAIGRYLEAISARKAQTQAGWSGHGELGLGYDSNITGVPVDFGAAAQQASPLVIEARQLDPAAGRFVTARSGRVLAPLRADGPFRSAAMLGRAYAASRTSTSVSGEARPRCSAHSCRTWRATAVSAPRPVGLRARRPQAHHDRRMGARLDWRHALTPSAMGWRS